MSQPSSQQQTQQQPSSQNGFQYPYAPYPSDAYDGPRALGHMDPRGHNQITNYPADPQLFRCPQPPPQPSMSIQHYPNQPQQDHQPNQQDYNRPPHQVQYIPTPPPVVPGVFQNPNSSPFTTTPRTAVQNTTPPPIRFQCGECGSTFSRMHDRNRHYESTHSENRPVHKCERCRKEFSRADAKKRHQDDGKCSG